MNTCRFCSNPFEPPKPETDVCRFCYFAGETWREHPRVLRE